MATSGDTFGFLESSWNRGILSRMARHYQTDGLSGAEIRTGVWAERFLMEPLHPSHLCQIGESDQGHFGSGFPL
jgi:hypothetical protein